MSNYVSAINTLFPSGPPADYRDGAIVFPATVHAPLFDAMGQIPGRHRVSARLLTDGRYMIGADLLTEIAPGRLYAAMFAIVPPEAWAVSVAMPMADARALLPPDGAEL